MFGINLMFSAVLFFALSQVCVGSRFGYSEPSQNRWARHHGSCGGHIQSPIAIYTTKAIPLHLPGIDLIGYRNLLPYPLHMTNNGHTVSLSVRKLTKEELDEGDFLPYIRGGKLPGEFEIESIHFHWGYKNNRGSEHVINDIRYTMEMHMVHRNKKYENVTMALAHPDGIAVMAFFYNLEETEGTELVTITNYLNSVPESNTSEILPVTFELNSLISSVDVDKFYTYKGSLTTPPCSEAVTWVLFPTPIPITPKQITRFRQLQDNVDGSLVDNFRRVQPLGNRRIFMRIGHYRHTRTSLLEKEVDYRKWGWFL